jgi:hypothetical protein
MLRMAFLGAAIALAAQAAAAATPITLKMAPGHDSITVKGVLTAMGDCCAYAFEAAAGQKLSFSETGANGKFLLHFPGGDTDGPYPGPYTWTATTTGTYVIEIGPNLKFDHATGPFALTLRIPPK